MNFYTTKILYKHVFNQLKEVHSERESKAMSYLLLKYFFDLEKTDIQIEKDIVSPEEEEIEELDKAVNEINNHRPIQYVLGETEFYGLNLFVSEGVLIPRPETEELVDTIIKDYKNEKNLDILDIGTGSGCIAIALAKNLDAKVTAVDKSEEAIAISKDNIAEHKVDIRLFSGDILEDSLNEQFDIIVSNPPYIKEEEKVFMEDNVLEYEPEMALFVPDEAPLLFYNRILELSKTMLKPTGKIYCEINEAFGDEIKASFSAGGFKAEILKDMQGKDRMLVASKK